MDSPPADSSNKSETNAKSSETLQSYTLAIIFSLLSILSLSYLTGFYAVVLASVPVPSVSLPSQCRIVSSSVDLRTSKVCELGLLNYKAKRVFYPSERKRFRCRFDYYWASIFKVEYKEHFSGQMLLGLAEAPMEALPSDCRPNFMTAFLTKHKLKVNETYDCWYTSGRSNIEIFQDSYFGCQAKDPSLSEMMRRYFILSSEIMLSWLSGQLKAKHLGWGMIIGAFGGFFTALITIFLFTVCRNILCLLPRAASRILHFFLRQVILTRLFFLVAYLAIVAWVSIEYGKQIDLGDIFVEY